MIADDYLRRVAFALRDLPWKMRRDLISELRAHLDELPADTQLQPRLGTPEQYAAEMRAAAGLERRRSPIAFLLAQRPRKVGLAVVALTVIGLAIAAVVWIDSYQPLAFAGGSYEPIGAKRSPGGDGEYVVFRTGRPFRFGITVQNTGRFAVRVLGVPYPRIFPFDFRLLMSLPQRRDEFLPPYVPFHPFDLKPGDMRLLLLKGAFACHSGTGPGNAFNLDPFPVRYRFLWHTATTSIPFGSQLAITFPKGCTYQR